MPQVPLLLHQATEKNCATNFAPKSMLPLNQKEEVQRDIQDHHLKKMPLRLKYLWIRHNQITSLATPVKNNFLPLPFPDDNKEKIPKEKLHKSIPTQ